MQMLLKCKGRLRIIEWIIAIAWMISLPSTALAGGTVTIVDHAEGVTNPGISGISANGEFFIGTTTDGTTPFTYSDAEGLEALAEYPSDANIFQLYAISDDGKLVTGYAIAWDMMSFYDSLDGFRYENSTYQILGTLDWHEDVPHYPEDVEPEAHPQAMSADQSIMYGSSGGVLAFWEADGSVGPLFEFSDYFSSIDGGGIPCWDVRR
jgi:hypothetical protein